MASGQISVCQDRLRTTTKWSQAIASRIDVAIKRFDEHIRLTGYVLFGYQAGEIHRRYHAKRDMLNTDHVCAPNFANLCKEFIVWMEEAGQRLPTDNQTSVTCLGFFDLLAFYISMGRKNIATNYPVIIDGFLGARNAKQFVEMIVDK